MGNKTLKGIKGLWKFFFETQQGDRNIIILYVGYQCQEIEKTDEMLNELRISIPRRGRETKDKITYFTRKQWMRVKARINRLVTPIIVLVLFPAMACLQLLISKMLFINLFQYHTWLFTILKNFLFEYFGFFFLKN